ncbi:capsule assembly Wzi family protein [Sediminibacterium sp.]|uniref:capsule assembly Wzi family protein n=1 Tax=Sediminibacterium sp. TaxID=1917865 RepID=UPI003F705414
MLKVLNFADSNILLKSNSKKIQLLPISWNTKFNSHHPFGWNDAGMRMVRGFQQSFSAGFFWKVGPLSVQLQPEYYHINPQNYQTTTGFGFNSNKPLSKSYWGQSSIRLNTKSLSLGISTENLWWGPGQFSSLFMSNNAPGFKHVTFNTRKPIKTWMGNFEWQLIVGQLNEDTSLAFESNYLKSTPAKNEPRYFNAFVITYQPKWMENIFFGLIRFEQLYLSVQETRLGGFFKRYLPALTYESASENIRGAAINDGGVGVFGRWIMPTQKTEFYFEYGYNDFKQNIRDLTANSSHANAFLAGFKKMIKLKDQSILDVSSEIVNMAQNPGYIIRNGGNWYTHAIIRQGYTHQNQIMGAGSGFGNNVQTLLIKKIKLLNYFGLKLQRIKQDPKGLILSNLSTLGMRNIIWNDYDFGFLFQKRVKSLILNGEAHWVHSNNYGWERGNQGNLFLQLNCLYILP